MPRVAILPSAVADQIAAGEVVERPASVVKELVENALDAGAQTIDVVVEEGGRVEIRVSDDGCGMAREDALLALERHATSKIRSAEDLVGVASYGFRGEALPAICSVSHLELVTCAGDGAATVVRADGGAVAGVTDGARRRGTTVSVRGLFYNAPARLKFMRGTRAEWRGVTDALSAIALARRDVRFSLSHDGKPVLTLPPAPSLRARVAALWGAPLAERLVEVDDVIGETHVAGLVERPRDVGLAGRRVWVAVNGRVVRDHGIARAAEAAYRSTLPSGLRPSLLLELVVPPDTIDVNVHPAKAEIRFRDRWPVERAVEAAVRRALGTIESAASLGAPTWTRPAYAPGAAPEGAEALRVAPAPAGPLFRSAAAVVDVGRAGDGGAGLEVPPLVQLRRTYLLFERDDGVVLVDQHSAHERVLYEEFLRALESGRVPSQRLLLPLTLHLAPAEAEAFEAHRERLDRLGFEAEPFGGTTLVVRSVPTPHARFDALACLRETLAALAGDRAPAAAGTHERLAATVACKAAIKAGDPLSLGEMRALYLALAGTTLPAHDVHGRATLVHLGWDELERRFGRR